MFRSANQRAQAEGDTGANEARRIRDREMAVRAAWREEAWQRGEPVEARRVARATGLPEPYVRLICERGGNGVV
jgi:hypothetical protein